MDYIRAYLESIGYLFKNYAEENLKDAKESKTNY